MRTLRYIRPGAACLYFIAVIGGTVFVSAPLIRIISLVFAALSAVSCGLAKAPLRDSRFYLIVGAAVMFLNPVIVTYGSTPLFMLGSRPYTLEALLYGCCNAMALIAVMLWFRLFTAVLTSDRINAMLRRPMFSSAASVFTLTLRYVPEMKRRYADIRQARKMSGYRAGETYFMRIKADLDDFFSLTAASLELSAVTADSMKARGYALKPHTFIGDRPVSAGDVLFSAVSVAAAAYEAVCRYSGSLYAVFYPVIRQKCPVSCTVCFGALCSLPFIFAVKEEVKWRSSGRIR